MGKRNLILAVVLVVLIALISACQTSKPIQKVDSREPVRQNPVNVFQDVIKAQALEALAVNVNSGNLFSNGGFENGLDSWGFCDAAGVGISNDAFEGTSALKLNPANCFYQSVEATADQEFTLSCHAQVVSGTEWVGMGLSFSDSTWTKISDAPTAIISGNSYQRYDVNGTAPANSSYVSMWLYSNNAVLVDSCTLMLNDDPPPPPPPGSGDNLLENGTFETTPLTDWTVGCGGLSNLSTDAYEGNQALNILDSTCVDQGLSASDVSSLASKDYTYSCYAKNTGGYASLSIFFDDVPVSEVIPQSSGYQLVELKGTAPATASTGFVSLYSNDNLLVDQCSLSVDGIVQPPTNEEVRTWLEQTQIPSFATDKSNSSFAVSQNGIVAVAKNIYSREPVEQNTGLVSIYTLQNGEHILLQDIGNLGTAGVDPNSGSSLPQPVVDNIAISDDGSAIALLQKTTNKILVYEINGAIWQESSSIDLTQFGPAFFTYKLALDETGDTLFVNNINSKLVVFEKISGAQTSWQTLTTDIPTGDFDYSNNILAVTNATNMQLFERNAANSWTLIKSFDLPLGSPSYSSVSLSDDTLLVSVPTTSIRPLFSNLIVYERNAGGANNWGEVKQTNDIYSKRTGEDFVDISGDYITIITAKLQPRQSMGETDGLILKRNQGGTNNWGKIADLNSRDFGKPYQLFLPNVQVQCGQLYVNTSAQTILNYSFTNQGYDCESNYAPITVENTNVLSGAVFGDTNRNGVVDSGEEGFGNVGLELFRDTNNNGLFDDSDAWINYTYTSSIGTYNFSNLPLGRYIIRFTEYNDVLKRYEATQTTPIAFEFDNSINQKIIDFGVAATSINLDGINSNDEYFGFYDQDAIENFGNDLVIQDNLAVVAGATPELGFGNTSLYFYEKQADQWVATQSLRQPQESTRFNIRAFPTDLELSPNGQRLLVSDSRQGRQNFFIVEKDSAGQWDYATLDPSLIPLDRSSGAISDNYVAIGNLQLNDNYTVRVLHKVNGQWTVQADIPMPQVDVADNRRNFGRALSLTDTELTILSDRYFYFYERTGSTWNLVQKIESGDYRQGVIAPANVSFEDDTIVLVQQGYQQFQNGVGTLTPGKLFVYEKGINGWSESQTGILPLTFGAARVNGVDLLGNSFVVSVDKSTVDSSVIAENGKVILYQKQSGAWQTKAFLRPLNKPEGGYSVSLNCGKAYLGSPYTTSTNLGSIFTFDIPNHVCN